MTKKIKKTYKSEKLRRNMGKSLSSTAWLVEISLVLLAVSSFLFSLASIYPVLIGIGTGIISGLIVYVMYYFVEIRRNKEEVRSRELNASTSIYESWVVFLKYFVLAFDLPINYNSKNEKLYKKQASDYLGDINNKENFNKKFKELKGNTGYAVYSLLFELYRSLIDNQWGFYDERKAKLIISGKGRLKAVLEDIRRILEPDSKFGMEGISTDGKKIVIEVRPYGDKSIGENFIYSMKFISELDRLNYNDLKEVYDWE